MREKVWLRTTGRAAAKADRQGGWKFRVLPPGLPARLRLALAPSLPPPCPSPFPFLPLPTFPCFSKAGELTAKPKQPYLTQNTSKPPPFMPSCCLLCLPIPPLGIHLSIYPGCSLGYSVLQVLTIHKTPFSWLLDTCY